MNPTPRINGLALRAGVGAALLCAFVASATVQAGDATKRALSASPPGPHAATAAPAAPTMNEQLERLALQAAMVDSSAFGQLRILRDVEAKTVNAKPGIGAREHCR